MRLLALVLWCAAGPLAAEPPALQEASAAKGFSGRAAAGAGEEDLDGDGIPERWTSTYAGGSGFGGRAVDVHAGAGEPLRFDGFGSFGDFLGVTRVPDGASVGLIQGVAGLLYGRAAERTLATADGSLAWLWARDARPTLQAAPPLRWVRTFDLIWASGPPTPPDSQYLIVDQEAAPVLAANWPGEDPPTRGLIAYYAHNHGALRAAGRCGARRLFVTDHAVVLAEEARHAWVWVSTHVGKLRWKSVEAVECRAGLIEISLVVDGQPQRVVVAPALGRYGELAGDAAGEALLDILAKAR